MHSSPDIRSRSLRTLLLSLLIPLFLLGGCATTNPRDPLEPMNRAIYSFNDGLDNAIFKPVAQGYRAVLPEFVRTGVSNFFANINDVLIALNNLLQGKFLNAVSDVGRILVNTTIGVAGFLDVATNLGLEKHNEDFGQTLGRWGIGDGPYLVLPIVGPSNLRDALARVVDFKTDPLTYVRSMRLRNSLWGTRAVSDRANLLDTSKILETAALDPYEVLRDAYLQRRRNLVHDGAPPREKDGGAMLKNDQLHADSPFPTGADSRSAESGTPLPSSLGEHWTPARADALRGVVQPVLAETPLPAPTPATLPVANIVPERDVAPTPILIEAPTQTQPVDSSTAVEPAVIPETAPEQRNVQQVVRVWVSSGD